ncbi:MAG: SGNH/GDSL hydrolase family protein [Clostridiales bacterium]|nr:SGNH/GDSL hydrolase family protein [Clostridiales bacterium]
MKKKIIASLLIASFLIAGLWFAQRLVMPKYQGDIVEGSMVEEYYKETTDHDVLFIGDCEVYENFSTMKLWEEYGITSYIRGSSQQLIWQSYYLLEDTYKYETPKVVVFNVLALKYNTPQKEEYNRMTIDGMKWSKSKIDCINASMIPEESFIDYVFPILRYHSRWSELTQEDFDHIFSKRLVTHNGYYMRTDIRPQGNFPEPMPLDDYTFGSTAMMYLDKIRDICNEHGSKLVLIKAPTEYPYWYDEWDKQVEDYAKENGLTYINMIPLQEEIGLDMSVDTYDAGLHLNLTGAEKLSVYFGRYLMDNFNLEDHRNDPKISEVYSKKVEYYNKMIEEQKKELEE